MPRPRARIREIYVSSLKKESAYRATAQPTSGYTRMRVMKTEFPNPNHNVKTDADQIGPTLEPNEQIITTQAYSFDISQSPVRPNTLATVLAYLLGTDTMLSPDTKPGPTRQHEIRLQERNDPPSMVIWEKSQGKNPTNGMGTDIKVQYKGVSVQSCTLSAQIGDERAPMLRASLLAAERNKKVTAASASPKYPGDDSIFRDKSPGEGANPKEPMPPGGGEKIYFSTTPGLASYASGALEPITGDATALPAASSLQGAAEDMTPRVHSVGWTFDNGSDPPGMYRLGGGKHMLLNERGDISQSVDINFDYENEAALEAFENQTPYAIQWVSQQLLIGEGTYTPPGNNPTPNTSAKFYTGFNCIWPRLQYNGYTRTEVGGNLVCQANFTPLPDTINRSVLVDVFNAVDGAYAGA